uniref:Uncharacterized protein n=1 Tax=Anguilla anguilla TaxID=7936 RepID=A0A0E9VC85_ANGAN
MSIFLYLNNLKLKVFYLFIYLFIYIVSCYVVRTGKL